MGDVQLKKDVLNNAKGLAALREEVSRQADQINDLKAKVKTLAAQVAELTEEKRK